MKKSIIGQKIVSVRQATDSEKSTNYWDEDFIVIELENGIKLYPSCDDEGNGPGVIFGEDKNLNFVLF
jgi:hypothetical protein